MRRRLAGSLLFCMLASSVAAQQSAIIGPLAGINFAKFGGDDVGDVDTRTGFQAGLFAVLPLSRFLALMPSVSYSQEGTAVNPGGGVSGSFKLDYLEVPVLLKLSAELNDNENLRTYAVAGPAVGFQLKCQVHASSGSQSADVDCDDPTLGLDSKKVQFSGVFGAGLDIDRFTVGLRYQLGLSSIDDTGADADIKNRVLSIVAGYGFRLGRR
jgi:hypothetical protein